MDSRRTLRLALRYLKEIVEKSTESETRAANALLLTIKKDAIKVEAYKALQDYLRCRVSSLPVGKLCGAFGGSLANATTATTYYSIMNLTGGEYWSPGEEKTDLIEHALDISASLKRGDRPGARTWLEEVRGSLYDPMMHFAEYILQQELQVEKWKESNGYAEGLKGLGNLVYWTVVHDAWLRKSAKPEEAAEWHFKRDVCKMSDEYVLSGLFKKAIRDDYASYALVISSFLGEPEKVDLGEGLRIWEVRIDFKELKNRSEEIKQRMEERKVVLFHFEKVILEIVSGHMRGVASPLRRITALWNGWAGSMLKEIAEASQEDNVVYLRMREPPFGDYPFYGPRLMRLTANTLAISRQLAHTYSYIGKLITVKAKKAGLGEVADEIGERLDPLYSKSPGWASKELKRIPARPLPSIYEQVFHTPTVMVGMAYNVLSSISLALELDPKIPPDPLNLIELDPVKEELGEDWSNLARPELSESVELLRASAQMPVGHLEWLCDFIEMALELYPVPDALRGW
jgi:hypothetical protein